MEHVNEIINNLCEKLGTTAEYLVPEYAKMKIAESWAAIVVVAILVAVYLIFLAVYLRVLKGYDWKRSSVRMGDAMEWIGAIAGVIGCVLAASVIVVCATCVSAIFKFTASPAGAFFDDMIKSIK